MAIRIIDLLEGIEIDQNCREGYLAVDEAGHDVIEASAVAGSGQIVRAHIVALDVDIKHAACEYETVVLKLNTHEDSLQKSEEHRNDWEGKQGPAVDWLDPLPLGDCIVFKQQA